MTGMMKDADSTAPGGMPLPALKVELVEEHGYKMADLRGLKWGAIIDMVVQARASAEVNAEYADDESGSLSRMVEQLDDDDADDLLADFLEDQPSPAISATPSTGTALAAETDAMPVPPVTVDVNDHDDVEAWMAEIEAAQAEHAAEQQARSLFLGMPTTRDFVFDGHAGAGPSGAERWMNCTASLGAARAFLETLIIEQQYEFASGSGAARQGTTAHAVGEIKAREMLGMMDSSEVDARLLDLTINPPEAEAYDEEMEEHLTEYLDLVRTYVDSDRDMDVEMRVEAVIPLTCLLDPADEDSDLYTIRGSADLMVMPSASTPVLTVGDLKYGNGIDVSVQANPQIRIYALGALDLIADDEGNLPEDLTTVEYVICQPRLGGVKIWNEPLSDLITWRDEVLAPALTAALTGEGAVFEPGEDTCQWCPARGTCSALAEKRFADGAMLFESLTEAEVAGAGLDGSGLDSTTLSDERLGTMLAQVLGLDGIKDALKEEAQRRLHRGIDVPGFRLVSYTPPRKWKEGAEDRLKGKKNLWGAPKLLTPKQAITVLGDDAAKIDALIDTPDKRPVISTGPKDKRKDWTGVEVENMFQIETGEE